MKLAVKHFRKCFTINFMKKKFENLEYSILGCWKIFYCWIHCKKNSKIFYSQFHWKKFRKFLIVNFRLLKNVLLLNSLQNKLVNFLQSISLKKHFEIFSENPKKCFCLKKQKGITGGGEFAPFFPAKSDTTFRWVLTFCYYIQYPKKTARKREKLNQCKSKFIINYKKNESIKIIFYSVVFFCGYQIL